VAFTPGTRRAALILVVIALAFWVWVPYALLARILINRGDLELAIVGGGLLLCVVYRLGGGLVLLKWTGILRPASDRLRAVGAGISDRMGIRPRSFEVLALPQANALAFPLRGRIAVTDAALAVLLDDELSAICAHELAHLSEPRWVGVVRLMYNLHALLLFTLVVLTVSLTDRVFELETGIALCFAGDILWLCGLFFYSRLHRRMEVRADAMASQFEGEPGTYARALGKLHQINAIPMVIRPQVELYPEFYDRLISSGVAPDYPRPAPPPKAPFYLGLLVLIVGSVAGGFGLDWLASAIQ
jgi:Zn-dependent protease with chaperone function